MSHARLQQLLGASVHMATFDQVVALVTTKTEESFDIDFKGGLYPHKNVEGLNIAVDVAAMANTVGGVLVLGIREENSTAVEVRPVVFSEEEERWMNQQVVNAVFPRPTWSRRRLLMPGDDTRGIWLCIVERSRLAPHAVQIGENLKYPIRTQKDNRYLSEFEVADRYRQRFSHERDTESRLRLVTQEGAATWRSSHTRVQVALVPVEPGVMRLSEQAVRDVRTELWSRGNQRGLFAQGIADCTTGFHRMRIQNGERKGDELPPQHYLAELHTDGAGYAGAPLSGGPIQQAWSVLPGEVTDGRQFFNRFELLRKLAQLVNLLVEHAVRRSNCQGEALLSVQIVHPGTARPIIYLRPTQLGPDADIREPCGPFTSEHTLSLDLFDDDRFLVLRALLSDLYQSFGFADVDLIDENGLMKAAAWGNWASAREAALLMGVSASRVDEVVK